MNHKIYFLFNILQTNQLNSKPVKKIIYAFTISSMAFIFYKIIKKPSKTTSPPVFSENPSNKQEFSKNNKNLTPQVVKNKPKTRVNNQPEIEANNKSNLSENSINMDEIQKDNIKTDFYNKLQTNFTNFHQQQNIKIPNIKVDNNKITIPDLDIEIMDNNREAKNIIEFLQKAYPTIQIENVNIDSLFFSHKQKIQILI
jgi:hypothetical protein